MKTYEHVMSDIEITLEWLEDSDEPAKRRILYVAAIALLYAVSDVMDRDDDKTVRKAIQGARLKWKQESDYWKTNPAANHNWFYDFIRPERTRVVHEAIQNHSDDAPIVVSYATEEGWQHSENISDVYWPVLQGPLEGMDTRDALREALEWWKVQIAEMFEAS